MPSRRPDAGWPPDDVASGRYLGLSPVFVGGQCPGGSAPKGKGPFRRVPPRLTSYSLPPSLAAIQVNAREAVLREKERGELVEAGGGPNPRATAAIQVAGEGNRRSPGRGWGSWRSGCRSAFLE